MARTTVAAQLASIRKQQELLAKKAKALTDRTQGKAMAQIKRLAKENGITAEEIAAGEGISSTGIRVRLLRIRQNLRHQLALAA